MLLYSLVWSTLSSELSVREWLKLYRKEKLLEKAICPDIPTVFSALGRGEGWFPTAAHRRSVAPLCKGKEEAVRC